MKKNLRVLPALALAIILTMTGCAGGAKKDAAADKATEQTQAADTKKEEPAKEEAPKDEAKPAEGAVAVNPAGQFPIVNEPITLTFYREGTPTDEDKANFDKNKVMEFIKNKTNIKMDFVYVNGAEGKQKVILDFAANTYPDGALLDWNTLFNQSDVMQYGVKEGILVPLNDYIDTYGQEVKTIFDLRPTLRPLITAPDGNIYGLPRTTECGHCMSYPKTWINTAWLDKLGMKMPETTEDFYQVLKAFKEKDPNGNGQKDEIALTGSIDYSCAAEYWIMNSFIDMQASSNAASPRHFLSWIDNKVTFVGDKPEFKAGIEYAKKLYDEGLLDPANFTQKADGLSQQARINPDLATVGAYVADHMWMGADFGKVENAKDYHALPPVAGPTGVRFQSFQDPVAQMNGFQFAIFDKCENKEAAFRLADYFLSEEFLPIGHYGIEGVRWNPPTDANAKNILGGPLKWIPVEVKDDAPAEKILEKKLNSFWIPIIGDLLERRAMWTPEATPEALLTNYETYLEYETLKTVQYRPKTTLPRSLFMEPEKSEEFTELKMNVTNHVLKNVSMFITGARPIAEWDAYVEELKSYGSDRYVELYTEEYAKVQERMKQ